jgi:aspartate carbamoyltransferase catalytic subunit
MTGHRFEDWRVVLKAAERAQVLRYVESHTPESERTTISVFRVHSTHTAAHFLKALDELGWELVRRV